MYTVCKRDVKHWKDCEHLGSAFPASLTHWPGHEVNQDLNPTSALFFLAIGVWPWDRSLYSQCDWLFRTRSTNRETLLWDCSFFKWDSLEKDAKMADTKGRDCFSDSEEHQDNDFIPEFHQGTVRKNLFEDFALNSKRTDSQSGREFMKVFLRIRPLSSEEISSGEDQQCLVMENPSGVLTQAPKDSFTFKNSTRGVGEVNHRFTFSNVFPPETTQKTFFDETSLGMVKDFIEGQNCLLFTYGVTNSGKVNKRFAKSTSKNPRPIF